MIGSALELGVADPEHRARLEDWHTFRQRIEPSELRDGPEHVITGGRQEGKTRLAMQWLLDAPEGVTRVLLVPDVAYAGHLKGDYGFANSDPRIISYRQLLNRGPRPGVEYGIDETVTILSALLGLHSAPHLLTICTAAPWQRESTDQ